MHRLGQQSCCCERYKRYLRLNIRVRNATYYNFYCSKRLPERKDGLDKDSDLFSATRSVLFGFRNMPLFRFSISNNDFVA